MVECEDVALDLEADPPGGKLSRQKLEKALAHELRVVGALRDIGQALGAALTLPELLELILARTTALLESDRATFYLLDEGAQLLRSEMTSGGVVHPLSLRVGEGIAGHVALRGRALRIDDAESDERFDPAWDEAMEYETESVLAAPLKNKLGRTVGVLQVHRPRGSSAFNDEDESILSAVSTQAAVAIDNFRLLGSLIKNNQKLSETKEQLERRLRDLELMFELERATAHATTREALINAVLGRLARACDARAAALLLRDEETGLLVEHAWRAESDAVVARPVSAHESLLSEVLEENVRQELDALPAREPLLEEPGLGIESFVAEPLEGTDGVFGALGLFNKDGEKFTEEDVSLLRLVSANVATAVRLFDASRAREREERLSSIGRLLSQVIHDFKSPMTVISGYVQLMEECDDEKQRRKYAEETVRQFEAVASMQREVLAFARGETDVFVRRVYLDRFFPDLRRELEQELRGQDVELALELEPKLVMRFDSERIGRALHNLVRNAVEAMAGQATEKRVTLGARRDGDALVLSVADTGPGIPEAVRARLFQSFVTAGKEGGTGLGLAIVRRIVEQHGGSVSVSSRPEATRFELRLPQQSDKERAGKKRPPADRDTQERATPTKKRGS
jgi:signal transduction histidine kinase/putative methionine-R-sulfoxide reductase with GAF domain